MSSYYDDEPEYSSGDEEDREDAAGVRDDDDDSDDDDLGVEPFLTGGVAGAGVVGSLLASGKGGGVGDGKSIIGGRRRGGGGGGGIEEEDDDGEEDVEEDGRQKEGDEEEEDDEEDDDEEDEDKEGDEGEEEGEEDGEGGEGENGSELMIRGGASRKRSAAAAMSSAQMTSISDDESDSDPDGAKYTQRLKQTVASSVLEDMHPECRALQATEVEAMTRVVRDKSGTIIDAFHKTLPYLTKFEKARVLGLRAAQLNAGAPPFVQVPETIIDGYVIASMELEAKKLPFLLKRFLPNGAFEIWDVRDLEDVAF